MNVAARLISAAAAAFIMVGVVIAAVLMPVVDRSLAASTAAPKQPAITARARPEFRLAQAPAQPPAQAQKPVPSAPSAPTPHAAPPAPAPAPAATRQSDAEVVFTLVRTTLTALYQANVTGNYTVLRDLGAPGFRDKNSAADLARIFAPIRNAKIDLSQVVLLDPHISRAILTSQKMLDIVGSLDTKPLPVNFELLFEAIGGVWRLFGISVTPVREVTTTPPPTKPVPSHKPRKHRPKPPQSIAPKSEKPASSQGGK